MKNPYKFRMNFHTKREFIMTFSAATFFCFFTALVSEQQQRKYEISYISVYRRRSVMFLYFFSVFSMPPAI